jgi:hypothetical protein
LILFHYVHRLTGARLASLIFALHPIHVEAVASVVGRADTLCGLFYCTSIYLYTKAIRPNDQKGMINGNNDHLQTLVKIGGFTGRMTLFILMRLIRSGYFMRGGGWSV